LTAALAAVFVAPAVARDRGTPTVAFAAGSVRSVVDRNRLPIKILGAPRSQPATVHPTRSFAILQAAEYDAVVAQHSRRRARTPA
jgi:hypothetical protein